MDRSPDVKKPSRLVARKAVMVIFSRKRRRGLDEALEIASSSLRGELRRDTTVKFESSTCRMNS